MRQDPLAIPSAWNQSVGFAQPLFALHREAGLAAIAVELNLQVDELAPEVAEAVERGAAALFLGGYGPYSTLTRQSAGVGKEAPQLEDLGLPYATKARRSPSRQKSRGAAR